MLISNAVILVIIASSGTDTPHTVMIPERFLDQPQVMTGPRLLHLGESITFCFYLPEGTEAGDVFIFPRYLEEADPGPAFRAGGDLSWVDTLPRTRHTLSFTDETATLTYTPEHTGSYLMRWHASGEMFYRYFAVVDDEYVVVRFATHLRFEPEPSLHATGIPLTYRLPVEKFVPDLYFYEIGHEFDEDDIVYNRLISHHRHFGDMIVPDLRDTPDMTQDDRQSYYASLLEKARTMLPDPSDAFSARVEKSIPGDPGYVPALVAAGVRDHCGMWIAYGDVWLGMPEFPYFASPSHILRVHQGCGGSLLSHQWDFAGSFHFLGPADWHYYAAEGDWEQADHCLRHGMEEAALAAQMSGHPVFFLPLYDGAPLRTAGAEWEMPYKAAHARGDVHRYIEHYQRLIAFEFTKQYKLVFARTLDIADYYTRHFKETPRTVFVSRTDHPEYDALWLPGITDNIFLPHDQDMNAFHAQKFRSNPKIPLSTEYVHIEDARRQIRFERACPNPTWWFDYTQDALWPRDIRPYWVSTPHVSITQTPWEECEGWLVTRLDMESESTFSEYAVCLWGIPAPYTNDPSHIVTNAREVIPVKNNIGEFHTVLVFDLEPSTVIEFRVQSGETPPEDNVPYSPVL